MNRFPIPAEKAATDGDFVNRDAITALTKIHLVSLVMILDVFFCIGHNVLFHCVFFRLLLDNVSRLDNMCDEFV